MTLVGFNTIFIFNLTQLNLVSHKHHSIPFLAVCAARWPCPKTAVDPRPNLDHLLSPRPLVNRPTRIVFFLTSELQLRRQQQQKRRNNLREPEQTQTKPLDKSSKLLALAARSSSSCQKQDGRGQQRSQHEPQVYRRGKNGEEGVTNRYYSINIVSDETSHQGLSRVMTRHTGRARRLFEISWAKLDVGSSNLSRVGAGRGG